TAARATPIRANLASVPALPSPGRAASAGSASRYLVIYHLNNPINLDVTYLPCSTVLPLRGSTAIHTMDRTAPPSTRSAEPPVPAHARAGGGRGARAARVDHPRGHPVRGGKPLQERGGAGGA